MPIGGGISGYRRARNHQVKINSITPTKRRLMITPRVNRKGGYTIKPQKRPVRPRMPEKQTKIQENTYKQKNQHVLQHSNLSLREKPKHTCKQRPEPKRKSVGSGLSRAFIPWCDRKK